jgi:hypothetical protein
MALIGQPAAEPVKMRAAHALRYLYPPEHQVLSPALGAGGLPMISNFPGLCGSCYE